MAQSHSSDARKSGMFHSYGRVCASHPWEVIIFVLAIFMYISMAPTASSFHSDSPFYNTASVDSSYISRTSSLSPSPSSPSSAVSPSSPVSSSSPLKAESESGAFPFVTWCLAPLFVYYLLDQFYSLYKGSTYLLYIAGLFTLVSVFIFLFTSTVMNVLKKDLSNSLWPLILLLTVLPKTSRLAQFALRSYTREDVRENIARGMASLGPLLTLDSVTVTLVLGMGTLVGDHKTEELSHLACLSVGIYYIVFMTLFPACLSLVLELTYTRYGGRPVWPLKSLAKQVLQLEATPNPVIQRVKVVMSAGLMVVHTLSRFQVDGDTHATSSQSHPVNTATARDSSSDFLESDYFKRQFGGEQILLIGLVCALAIKYVFFDSRENDSLLTSTSSASNITIEATLTSSSSSPVNHEKGSSMFSFTKGQASAVTQVDEDEAPAARQDTATSTSDAGGKADSVPCNVSAVACPSLLVNGMNRLSTSDCRSNGQSFYISDSESSSDSNEVETADREIQTIESNIHEVLTNFKSNKSVRSIEESLILLNSDDCVNELTDEEVLNLVQKSKLPSYRLESALNNPLRGVHIRRLLLNRTDSRGCYVNNLPYLHYDYSAVMGACCENVIGYVPVPVGIAGPLLLNGVKYNVPMATTEGCLVASTNRGCRALTAAGGVTSSLVSDGMTRAPVVSFPSASRAAEVMNWLHKASNFVIIKEAFDSTSRFARLNEIKTSIAANLLYIRLSAETGDAMGMNMLSKGAENAMKKLKSIFPDMTMIALSGNVCTDKKPSAINWIEGRGKSVVCEATIPASVLETVLKTTAESLESLNLNKNLIGSALAGSIGGFNAHAANIVTAIYIATGQDPAQNVGSSNCMTLVRATGPNRKDLYVSCTMPSIEVGTIGGGTILAPQAACLQLLGVRGSCTEEPGKNARQLASIVCAAVLAGELSVLSALATGDLVRSHMKHNRSSVSVNATNPNELSTTETNLKLGTCVQ